jgi:hypothetical protein
MKFTANTTARSTVVPQLPHKLMRQWCSLKQKTLNAQRGVVGQAFLPAVSLRQARTPALQCFLQQAKFNLVATLCGASESSILIVRQAPRVPFLEEARLTEKWLQKTSFQINGALK